MDATLMVLVIVADGELLVRDPETNLATDKILSNVTNAVTGLKVFTRWLWRYHADRRTMCGGAFSVTHQDFCIEKTNIGGYDSVANGQADHAIQDTGDRRQTGGSTLKPTAGLHNRQAQQHCGDPEFLVGVLCPPYQPVRLQTMARPREQWEEEVVRRLPVIPTSLSCGPRTPPTLLVVDTHRGQLTRAVS